MAMTAVTTLAIGSTNEPAMRGTDGDATASFTLGVPNFSRDGGGASS